jgi:hypothetical protein
MTALASQFPSPGYKKQIPDRLREAQPEDDLILYGKATFGATDTAGELDCPMDLVKFFSGTCLGATQTTAGEYTVTTDGVVTSSAITVCRQGHVDDANQFYYMVIGKPLTATTAAGSL